MTNLAQKMNIQTFTGKSFNLFDVKPSLICIEDIAHALSNLTRFTGHTKRFYSIAEHCVHVASLLPIEMKLTGLMHDAAEAYINDLSTPLKHSPGLQGYRLIEGGIESALHHKFKTHAHMKPHIKSADRQVMVVEARKLLSQPLIPEWSQLLDEIGAGPKLRLFCWCPRRAKQEFLKHFEYYTA